MGKERPRWTFAVVGFLGAWLIRLLHATWRVREEPRDHMTVRQAAKKGPPGTIYAMWHSRIVLAVGTQAWHGVRVVVSQHGDGEYITRVIHRMGFDTVRGSSSRGGARALIEVIRTLEEGYDVGITPDGPKGPRFRVQPGCIAAASKTGAAIVPLAFEARWRRRLRSWDRFMVPYFFSKVSSLAGEPFLVPPGLDAAGIEEWAKKLEVVLIDLHRRAALAVGAPPETAEDDPLATRGVTTV